MGEVAAVDQVADKDLDRGQHVCWHRTVAHGPRVVRGARCDGSLRVGLRSGQSRVDRGCRPVSKCLCGTLIGIGMFIQGDSCRNYSSFSPVSVKTDRIIYL